MDTDIFWAEDPCVLFQNFTIFPTAQMSREQKLNTISRLVIVISIVMFAFGYQNWLNFILAAFLIIFLINYMGRGILPENINIQEHFTVPPTFNSIDFQQTTVAPLFAEEWQIIPPSYDLVSSIPKPPIEQTPVLPPSVFPYGQVLSNTNLLPADEHLVRQLDGSTRNAREYVNSTFLRNDLAERDNLTRIYKKKLERRFRQNCSGSFGAYSSY